MKHLTLVLMFTAAAMVFAGTPDPHRRSLCTDNTKTPNPSVTGIIPIPGKRLLDNNALFSNVRRKQGLSPASTAGFHQELGVRFQENRGQIVDTDGRVVTSIAFVAQAPGARLYFRNDGISYIFTEAVSPLGEIERGYRLDMTLLGSNPHARIRPSGQLPGYVNYYLPHCPDGITGIREYSGIVYENVYDNVDLELFSSNGKVKYNFVVRPGGRFADILMQYDGATETALKGDGALAVATPIGGIEEATPYSYVDVESNAVGSRFLCKGNTVSFAVGEYDPSQTLVIDPWATYLGGSMGDACHRVATDANGNVYITGHTQSANFPVSTGAFQTSFGGASDGFVTAFDPSGQRLWATYFGGSIRDWAVGIDLDASGNVIVVGCTESRNFPVTTGAFQRTLGGSIDAFVAKFTGSGILIWSTYYGGRSEDMRSPTDMGVAVDANGNIIFTGSTVSTDFPVTSGAFQPKKSKGPQEDAYLVKLNPSGGRIWATYYGGKGLDVGHDVAFDESNDIYFVGGTWSSDFPVSPGCFQSTYAGGGDGFVVKFTSAGSRSWGTYCGGNDGARFDVLMGAAIGSGGSVLVSGSAGANFPVTTGTFQTQYAGGGDAVVAKFLASGTLAWSTYCGGSGGDEGTDVDVDPNGNIVFAGYTSSTDYPVTNALQGSYGGNLDCCLTKMDGNGTALLWSTYYGGSAGDNCNGIDVSGSGTVTIVGSTGGSMPTYNPFQPVYGGSGDGMIVQLNSNGQFTKRSAEISSLPGSVVLEQNYPNPFFSGSSGNPSTTIAFTLPDEMSVRLSVLDMTGRERAVIVDDVLQRGRHARLWQPGDELSSGMYLLRLVALNHAGQRSEFQQRMILTK